MYSLNIRRRAMKDIARLPTSYPRRVSNRIEQLAENPRPPGSIKLTDRPGHRVRVGVYRILYEINDAKRVVTVLRVQHRRDAYR